MLSALEASPYDEGLCHWTPLGALPALRPPLQVRVPRSACGAQTLARQCGVG